MAVFTELSFDQVTAFFRALDLSAPRSVRGITGGIENTNYFVDTDWEGYVLTIFERLTFEELPFYLHFMKHLAARGMSVPNPVADPDGAILHSLKGRPAAVVNRLPVQARRSLRSRIVVPSENSSRRCTWLGPTTRDSR
ncbi:phosphotransferase [Bradyrhizobium sp. CCGB12]|uniref:phosphotransferase n=1 Tax=Bradyrhizobium sp. CCGB12 TaxID=2949632 RepID=UPI0035C2081E